MRPGILACAAALTLAAPAVAGAETAASVVLYGAGTAAVTQQSARVRVSGALIVDFHGDPASGCATRGLCGYSGWVAWRPPPTGSLTVLHTGRDATPSFPSLQLTGGSSFGAFGGVTNADVARASGTTPRATAHCLDAAETGDSIGVAVHGQRIAVDLAQAVPSVLQTRCAGPRGEVLRSLPRPALTLNAIRRGGSVVSLAVSRPFSSAGFAGTIRSTIVLRLAALGKPTKLSTGSTSGGRRYRELIVDYRMRIGGAVTEHVSGAGDPAICGPLDSCGASGTVTELPRVDAPAKLIFFAPVSQPSDQLLTDIGRGPDRHPGRVTATGFGRWAGDGTIQTRLVQDGIVCHDSGALGAGAIILGAGKGRLAAAITSLAPGDDSASECPGPDPPVGLLGGLAAGEVPVTALARRTVRLVLGTADPVAAAGYGVRVDPHLTVTLTRLRTRTTVVTEPPGVQL